MAVVLSELQALTVIGQGQQHRVHRKLGFQKGCDIQFSLDSAQAYSVDLPCLIALKAAQDN
jgi:hypothetical protein